MSENGMRKIKLKDVCERITVGHVGPMADKYTDGGVPFLRSQNIMPFRLSLDDVKYVPPEFHESLRKSALRAGDVAVVRTGYPGTACVIPDLFPDLNCADLVVITPSEDLNPYYLAAIFNSAWGMASVAGKLVGAAQQHFNIGAARELEILLPSRHVQERVAGILSAYDDLMEISRRRIQVLETMGRSLYREWFVKFRFPGHETTPRTKQNLGYTPKGWQISCVRDLAELISRGPSLSYDEKDGIPVLNQRCIRNGEIELQAIQRAKPLSTKKEHLYLKINDVLVNSMGVGTLGRVSRNLTIEEPMIIHNCITVVRAKRGEPTAAYLYYRISDCETHFERLGVGATGQTSLRTEVIEDVRVALPPRHLLELFEHAVLPMWHQIGVLKRHIQNLRQTRDLLLPRMLSGAINLSTTLFRP
jgi:type I restriction enzyme, S subunit